MSRAAFLEFLAYSTQLEQESGERYGELADAMATHHNDEVAAFFRRMAGEARSHLAEVTELTRGETLPEIAAWNFEWPGAEPPETVSYEAVHYRMSLRQAIELALANERAAESFYRAYSRDSEDGEVQRIAADFADEEASHAAALEEMLRETPAASNLRRIDDDDPVIPE